MNRQGTLYIVATPIGNLDDISQRALNTLKEVDMVACEDTRHSARLLSAYGIKNRLISHHQHNESASSKELIELLKSGKNIALVSDAGTPLISDPGYPLVKSCHQHGIAVVPVPGACALTALLCSSGLPTTEFQFLGFLPAKSKARKDELNLIKDSKLTTVFYESTHRILDCLKDLQEVLGAERILTLGRELTKNFETIKMAKVEELKEFVESDSNQQKGEFVLALAPREKVTKSSLTPEQIQLAEMLARELPPKKAAKLTAQYFGCKVKDVYQKLIQSEED